MPVPTTANTPHPRAIGYGMALGTALFRPGWGRGREQQIETAPLEAPAFDTRTNPEELNEQFGRTFARDDFTGGEGLDFAHTRTERVNKESRFFDSKNIDIRDHASDGALRSIRLSRRTDQPNTGAGARWYMAWTGEAFFLARGTGGQTHLGKSFAPWVASPTFTSEDPHAGETAVATEDITALGAVPYAALGVNGIHRKVGGTWAHWSDIQATRVWAVKSRVIAAQGASLYEAVAGAAPTPLYTLPTGKTWQDVVDAGAAILAGADDGNIYAFAADTTTGALRLYNQTMLNGEYMLGMTAINGVVFYTTVETAVTTTTTKPAQQFWRTELGDDLALRNAQLLKRWEGIVGLERWALAVHATPSAVYTAMRESSTEIHLWRFDLAEGALSRAAVYTPSAFNGGSVRDILELGGSLFITGEAYLNDLGRTRTDLYASSGYLIGPLGDFFTSAVKSWVEATMTVADTGDGASVALYYTTNPDALTNPNHASWTLVDTVAASGVSRIVAALTGVESRYLAGKVVLTPNTAATATPAVRSFGFRAVPGGGGGSENVDQIINVPINISDQFERPNKRAVKIKGLGRRDYARVRAYQGEATTLTLYHPGQQITYRGLVESVGAPVQSFTERGSATVYAMVRFRGREVV